MKKLLLMIVALSFVAVMPKVASAFTMIELQQEVAIANITWFQGATTLDLVEGKGAQAVRIEGVQASNYAMNALAAGLSLKTQKNTQVTVEDTNSDGILELVAFAVGGTDYIVQ